MNLLKKLISVPDINPLYSLNKRLAKELYRAASVEKDTFSYLRLGDFYYYGYATNVNYKKAKEYYYEAIKAE